MARLSESAAPTQQPARRCRSTRHAGCRLAASSSPAEPSAWIRSAVSRRSWKCSGSRCPRIWSGCAAPAAFRPARARCPDRRAAGRADAAPDARAVCGHWTRSIRTTSARRPRCSSSRCWSRSSATARSTTPSSSASCATSPRPWAPSTRSPTTSRCCSRSSSRARTLTRTGRVRAPVPRGAFALRRPRLQPRVDAPDAAVRLVQQLQRLPVDLRDAPLAQVE